MTAPTLPPVVPDAAVAAESTTPKRRRRIHLTPPSWLYGVVAAGVALVVSLAVAAIPMVLTWVTLGQADLTWGETARGSLLLLAVAHGTPIVIGAIGYSLVPWGFVLLPAALLAGCAGWAARRTAVRDYRQAAILVGVMSLSYALAMVVVARLALLGDAYVSELSTFAHALAVALVATAIGTARSSELPTP